MGKLSIVSKLLIILALIFAIFLFIFVLYLKNNYIVAIQSTITMNPTFELGSRHLFRRKGELNNLSYGDIVLINEIDYFAGRSVPIIRRVWGLPGDIVSINNGVVLINGSLPNDLTLRKILKSWDEDDLSNSSYQFVDVVLGDSEVFVLADHLSNAIDSRRFGPVSFREIKGRWVSEVR